MEGEIGAVHGSQLSCTRKVSAGGSSLFKLLVTALYRRPAEVLRVQGIELSRIWPWNQKTRKDRNCLEFICFSTVCWSEVTELTFNRGFSVGNRLYPIPKQIASWTMPQLCEGKVTQHQYAIPCGLVVRISGFHPGGPGSIPGMGRTFLFFFPIVKFLISRR